jgi:Fe-S cluster assembly protein SufD
MPLLEKSPGTSPAALLRPGQDGHTDSAATFIPDQSRAERPTSFDVDAFPIPTGREEEWRFTPVDRLRALLTDTPTEEGAIEYAVTAPDGVRVSVLSPGQSPRGTALVPADRAAVVADANAKEATYIAIPPEAELTEPVRIVVTGQPGARSNGHVVLEAGHHSNAVVVLDHQGGGEHTGNVEVLVRDGADLTVVSIQQWNDEAHHLGQHDALVSRDAAYRHIAVSLGGSIVRINTNVKYSGPGGEATLLGVYFADAKQHLEHRSFVDHNAPHCKSRVTYKGALQGDSAHTVWVGDVLIRAEAEGTDTYEVNRNLVLTDGARADSVPNLEIETGEIVGAGHASATGRFDDEQLFYLQARGIPEDEARRLVVRGFLVDIINQIPVPDLRERLHAEIDEELAAAQRAGAEVLRGRAS